LRLSVGARFDEWSILTGGEVEAKVPAIKSPELLATHKRSNHQVDLKNV